MFHKNVAANTKGHFCNCLVGSSVRPAHLWLLGQGFKVSPRYRAQGQAQLPLQHDATPWTSWQPLQQAGGPPSQEGQGPCCTLSSTGVVGEVAQEPVASRLGLKPAPQPMLSITENLPNLASWTILCHRYTRVGVLRSFCLLASALPVFIQLWTQDTRPRSAAESAAQRCSWDTHAHPGDSCKRTASTHTRLRLLEGSTQETQTCRDTNSCSRLP